MSVGEKAPVQAIDLGRAFFQEVARPAMEKVCPQLLDQAACGRFGYGSECLALDDAISQDHHWGPRVDIMLPEKVFQQDTQDLLAQVSQEFPKDFRGYELEAGHVGGAGLDVFAEEPLPMDNPLWEMPNVLVSPHSGSTSDRENSRLTDLFCENLRRFLAKKPLLNVLDMKELY